MQVLVHERSKEGKDVGEKGKEDETAELTVAHLGNMPTVVLHLSHPTVVQRPRIETCDVGPYHRKTASCLS